MENKAHASCQNLQAQHTSGYKIKKQVEANLNIKLRHGALYPALNTLEQKGFLESKEHHQGRRARKAYIITENGKAHLQTYHSTIKELRGEKTATPKALPVSIQNQTTFLKQARQPFGKIGRRKSSVKCYLHHVC